MVNNPLIRPYFLGGVALGGGTLGSHDYKINISKRYTIDIPVTQYQSPFFFDFFSPYMQYPSKSTGPFCSSKLHKRHSTSREISPPKTTDLKGWENQTGIIKWDSFFSGHYNTHLGRNQTIYLLGQWLNFKLFGITYLVGKIKFKLFFPGSIG